MKKSNSISTAVLLAAGHGTRRLPITRILDKAMLPIGNRPVIDYVIEQCVEAGIQRIIIVVNSLTSLICQHYGAALIIEKEYPQLGVTGKVIIEYIAQPTGGYGTASALACVEEVVRDDSFVVLPADAFIYNPKDSALSRIVAAVEGQHVAGAVGGLVMNSSEARKYSIVAKDHENLTQLIEKPSDLDDQRTYEANVSYYVLPHAIFDAIRGLTPTNDEYYLTDAVVSVAAGTPIIVVPVEGDYLDSGQLGSWVQANILLNAQSL